jgi:uncharacterized membrane protein
MNKPALTLSAFLASAGTLHLVRPNFFRSAVPKHLPGGKPFWIRISGVTELGVAAAIALPQTRRQGSLAAAALFVAVFPGNISMALKGFGNPRVGRSRKVLLLARLPLQAPLVAWALRAASESEDEGRR